MCTTLRYTPVGGEYETLLYKHFVSEYREGYVRCEGTVLPVNYKQIAEDVLNLEVRDDDVWVCTFPKSGTTWTQEIVWCTAHNLDFEGAKTSILTRFPFLEASGRGNYKRLREGYSECNIPTYMSDSVNFVKNMPSPRFIKTHLPFHLLPMQLQQAQTDAKIVYTMRNVKDTCISYYHHSQLVGYHGDLDEFATLFVNDSLACTPFWDHILGYWKRRDNKNVLILKFEDLKKDLPSEIRKTAQFLGQKLTDQQVEQLCQHVSFDNMKKNPAVNNEEFKEFVNQFMPAKIEGNFMPSGNIGQWKTKFSQDWIERFDQWTEESLEGTGLDFKCF